MNKIILPKKHLSWTQLDLWRRNKEAYKKQYFENGAKLDTRYLRFGKGIAKAIEEGTYKEMLPDLHVYMHTEYEVRVQLGGVNLLAYIDSYDDLLNVFDEYKTGKRDKNGNAKWTSAAVHRHDQLLFYATLLSIKRYDPTKPENDAFPWYCDLYWIETKDEEAPPGPFQDRDRRLALTGTVTQFRRNFDAREIERMKQEIIRVAHEISAAYQIFINEI